MTECREYFVYRTFDADGQLLYVGCTKRLDKRWSEHKYSARKVMVDAAARCKLQGPYTRDKARAIERTAIRTEEPLFGWTPTKHREECARTAWIKKRITALESDGADPYDAARRACADAEEWFPDPYEHEYAYRQEVSA